jgi:hypothetical protein
LVATMCWKMLSSSAQLVFNGLPLGLPCLESIE